MNLSEYSSFDVTYWLGFMEKNKRERMEKFFCDDDKKRSALGDFLLKSVLSEKMNIPLVNLEIISDVTGKPMLRNNTDIFLSLSHSDDLIACAISDRAVGIDVEKIRSVDIRLIDLFCTDIEKEYILDDKETIIARFFEIWTFKEAYYKATGESHVERICCFDYNTNRTFSVKNGYAVTTVSI